MFAVASACVVNVTVAVVRVLVFSVLADNVLVTVPIIMNALDAYVSDSVKVTEDPDGFIFHGLM